MIEGLDDLLEDNRQLGLPELRRSLQELLGGPAATGQVLDQHGLKSRKSRVYRLRFEVNGSVRSLIVKRLAPDIAQRTWLVVKRWLPAVGLSQSAPLLLDTVAERHGQCVWHIYEDLGDWALDAREPDAERVAAAVELIAQIHTRLAGHPLLAECRLYGGDLGIYFYTSNVRDAVRALESLRPPEVELSSERLALRDRLLERMYKLLDEQPHRAQALAELGGTETLLHGDLWTMNTFVLPTAHGPQARLIDWDHAAVGPVSYDLSTFLLRFPIHHRRWILDLYSRAVGHLGWRLPSARDLNLLFDTAECARFANRAIWPAIALLRERAEWGFEELAEVERWFEMLEPVLPLS
jgi:Phosphotransferase enzyme family